MKKSISFTFFLALFGMFSLPSAKAQSNHQIQLELFGSSLGYSLGYAYTINPTFTASIGFGYLSFGMEKDAEFGDSYLKMLNIPLTLTYLKGKGNNKLEVYAGLRFDRIDSSILETKPDSWNTWYVTPNIGLGYRNMGEHFFGSITGGVQRVSYLDTNDAEWGFVPGLKIGYRI